MREFIKVGEGGSRPGALTGWGYDLVINAIVVQSTWLLNKVSVRWTNECPWYIHNVYVRQRSTDFLPLSPSPLGVDLWPPSPRVRGRRSRPSDLYIDALKMLQGASYAGESRVHLNGNCDHHWHQMSCIWRTFWKSSPECYSILDEQSKINEVMPRSLLREMCRS